MSNGKPVFIDCSKIKNGIVNVDTATYINRCITCVFCIKHKSFTNGCSSFYKSNFLSTYTSGGDIVAHLSGHLLFGNFCFIVNISVTVNWIDFIFYTQLHSQGFFLIFVF